jgi:hypothetical protein
MLQENESPERLRTKDTIKMHLKEIGSRGRDSIKLVENVVMSLVYILLCAIIRIIQSLSTNCAVGRAIT